MPAAWLHVALCTVLWTWTATARAGGNKAAQPTQPVYGSIGIDKPPKDAKLSSSSSGWWPVWCVVATVLIALVAMLTAALAFYCVRRHKTYKKEKEEQIKQPAKVSEYVRQAQAVQSPPHAAMIGLVEMDATQRWDWRDGRWAGAECDWQAQAQAQQTATSPTRRMDDATQYHNVLVSTSERRRRQRTVGAQPSRSSLLAEAHAHRTNTPRKHSDMSLTQADATSMHSMSETVGPSEHVGAMAVDSD